LAGGDAFIGQIEIYQLLKDKKELGCEDFFTVAEIKKLLSDAGFSNGSQTSIQVAQLEAFGYLEVKMIKRKRNHWRAVRLKTDLNNK